MRTIHRSAWSLLLCGCAMTTACARRQPYPQCGGTRDEMEEQWWPPSNRPVEWLEEGQVQYVSEPIPPEERDDSAPPLLLDAPLVAIRTELQGGTPALPGKIPERCRVR